MVKHLFDAVIFDLDGVITKTALVHSIAWTRMFNDYLKFRENNYGEEYREFTHEGDYLPYVDGKPRYKGVADFLQSRNIDIPFGDPDDDTEKETACGLGNRKNNYFNLILEKDGVQVYESTVELLDSLKKENIRIGVASSSKNCKKVLEAAGLMHYFETRVDGIVSAEIGLKGKPEPDIFTTACDNLGVAYDKAVVIEDAVSGVQAGAKGGFGFTLGLDREGNREALEKNGADIVLNDISELGGISELDKWFEHKVPELKWSLKYHDYDMEKEKSRESLLSVGNGFFVTRGSMDESKSSSFHYSASYMSGLYNRCKSKIGDKWIENEDFVNFIDWTYVNFKIEGENWFNPDADKFSLLNRSLDFKTGLYQRSIIVHHKDGKNTQIDSKRFVSMENPHLAGFEYKITPLNYSSTIFICTELNGDIENEGVDRYKDLEKKQLKALDSNCTKDYNFLSLETIQSAVNVVIAESIIVNHEKVKIEGNCRKVSSALISSEYSAKVDMGKELVLRKMVSIHNSKDFKEENIVNKSIRELSLHSDFYSALDDSKKVWESIWNQSDIVIEGDRRSQMLIRLHIYHLYLSASLHQKDLDSGIPARGLHGEAYRGHIFWDELYVMPFYISQYPEIAKNVLMYRFRRLDQAREYADLNGYKGAMFPWQSGSDGREETQIVHLNPVSGEWGDDYSSLQRHISIAIAFNIWQYYHVTDDQEFMNDYGAEMFFEICRFWASMARFDEEKEKFHIDKVMGPDEFHEKMPNNELGGLRDNAYTNIMTIWCMDRAFDVLDQMEIDQRINLVQKIGLEKEELVKWKQISLKTNLNINDDGVIEQFEDYFSLKELDWNTYQKKYDNVSRLDRILKAEGNSPDDYKIAKQADTMMAYYNLEEDEIERIIGNLGFVFREDRLMNNFEYYLKRTSHGSTLSRVVHSYLAKKTGKDQLAWEMYQEALESDLNDIQGGTTAEGIHVGVMGGTVLSALTMYAGLNWKGEALRINPDLPQNWKSIHFNFKFKGNVYGIKAQHDKVDIYYSGLKDSEGRIFVRGERYPLADGHSLKIDLKK